MDIGFLRNALILFPRRSHALKHRPYGHAHQRLDGYVVTCAKSESVLTLIH